MTKQPSESTGALWGAREAWPNLPTLDKEATADVCVVGAGIAGMSVAYHLAREGKRVVVLEASHPGAGETGNTTAHLASALDDRFSELESMFGQEGSRLAADSHRAAVDRIEANVRDENIDCDFTRLDGYLFAPSAKDAKLIDDEFAAARRAGFTDVERLATAPLPGVRTGPCLRFPRQGRFHPVKYLQGLARAIDRLGGRLYSGCEVKSFEGGKETRAVTRHGPTVTAAALVVATNTPMNDFVTMHTKQMAYRSYVVTLRIAAGAVPDALYWDTPDPYHYVRLQQDGAGGHYLIVGGEDHKTGQADDYDERFRRLEEWTRRHFPAAGELATRWSGQVLEPADSLAYIGPNPGDTNVYIVTGDSGHGMTHGTIAGMLIRDLILGRDNPWATIYDPSRKAHRAPMEYARENLNVAAQYVDLLTPGEVKSADAIAPGEGAVMREGLTKVACHRDEQGGLHKVSAICTHLGCVVHWNRAEKTWDCPCHGSRFDTEGAVLNGPAVQNLAPVEEHAEAKG